MAGARTALEIAHRDAARACGAISLMIARGKVRRDDLRLALARLRAAAGTLENVVNNGGTHDNADSPC